MADEPDKLGHDFDGNLTNDGRWTYTWDAENRLVRMVANTATGPQQRMDFEFDAKGRRIGKKVWNNTAGSGSPAVEQKFVYDGWNLLAVLNSAFSPQTAYTWGLDLSGSLQGAGGVGGLLALNDVANGVQYCSYDGNGNLAALVKATDGAVTANYEYGPFGEALRLTGAMAKVNPFRFSTKYQDEETDLLYYGYRSYNPSVGRWLSRDPLEEAGWDPSHSQDKEMIRRSKLLENYADLYIFVGNAAIGQFDVLGLCGEPTLRCGVDVGDALNKTRENMIKRFKALDRPTKWKNCEPYDALLFDPLNVFALFRGTYSWDLSFMTWDWQNHMKGKGCGDCQQTVTLNKKCYDAWHVNYYSFGVICDKCGLGFRDMKQIINMWKTLNPSKWFDNEEAAQWFATMGFLGVDANKIMAVPWGCRGTGCAACDEKYQGDLGSVWPDTKH